jgi:hypothetical protein
MIFLAAGCLTLVFFWWLGRNYAKADPKKLASLLRRGGGIGALGGAALLLLRGRFDMAIPLAGLGWWMVNGGAFYLPGNLGSYWPGGQRGGAKPQPGRRSSVRSVTVAMELDHDTGDLTGQVVSGPYAGRDLGSFAKEELVSLRDTTLGTDPEGARLLEAYLDRRFPSWREHAQADLHARGGGGDRTMTQEEALQILGLTAGAGESEIRGAHRALMKKLHPDQGGSTYLASRVNQAKDVLLNRHN